MYELKFVVRSRASFDELAKDFYAHFDGIAACHGGRITLTVNVDAHSVLDGAVHTVNLLQSLLRVGVHNVDPDLVDIPEIAERLERTRQTVHLWATGKRRLDSTFPQPISTVGGKRIWRWAEVASWANRNLGAEELEGLLADDAAIIDAQLAARRRRQHATPIGEPSSTAWASTWATVANRPSPGESSPSRQLFDLSSMSFVVTAPTYHREPSTHAELAKR